MIVRQVIDDCLHEAMDVDGLKDLVAKLHSGEISAHFVDSVEPSVLSHEIVNSEPYTYLDDAPLEERRARQVQLRRGLPVEARDLSHLDPSALDKVRAEAAPSPRGSEELHEMLLSCLVQRPRDEWQEWFTELKAAGRAMEVRPGDEDNATGARAGEEALFWCATERRQWVEALYPGATFLPNFHLAAHGRRDGSGAVDADEAAALLVRGHLELTGPVTAAALARDLRLPMSRVQVGLARLESEGFAMQGSFDPGTDVQWCARHLLARAHSYSQNRLRREIKPVSVQDFMRFLVRWQHVAMGSRRQGRAGLLSVVEQLQGWELAAGAWEEAVLPARVEGYQRRWLEDLCLSGEVTWAPPVAARPGDRQPEH